ncbi:MAG: hypothetical protein AAF849_03920 [Bacteroidota bacterium]
MKKLFLVLTFVIGLGTFGGIIACELDVCLSQLEQIIEEAAENCPDGYQIDIYNC